MNKRIVFSSFLLIAMLGIVGYYSYNTYISSKHDRIAIANIKDGKENSKNTPVPGSIDTHNAEKARPSITNISEKFNKYLDYLKSRDNLKDDELIQVLQDDIDSDKNNEFLVSFGYKDKDGYELGNYHKKVYLLRETKNGFQEITSDFNGGGYGIYNVSLVRLDNTNYKYIYIQVTNGAHPLGCQIYALRNNKIETLFSEASPTGAGEYDLVDNNNDGIFDEIVSYRQDYGVAFHPMYTHYKLSGKTFEKSSMFYVLDEYPSDPEKVVVQYIDTLWLENNYGKNTQTADRIKELTINENVRKVDISEYVKYFYYNDEYASDSKNNLKFESSKIQQDTAEFTVGLIAGGPLNKKLTFKLRFDNGKWRIESII